MKNTDVGSKVCFRCAINKPHTEYDVAKPNGSPTVKDGYCCVCRDCHEEYLDNYQTGWYKTIGDWKYRGGTRSLMKKRKG